MKVGDVVGALKDSGTRRGELVALTLGPTSGLGLATAGGSWSFVGPEARRAVETADDALRPRWVMWSNDTAVQLARSGVRVAAAWDIAAVHRLIFGGWAAAPDRVWAAGHGLELETVPTLEPEDLFSSLEDPGGDAEEPIRPDGYVRPQWVAGGWHATPERLARWAALAMQMAVRQQAQLGELGGTPPMTARCESAAELLCAEMTVDGLPMDRTAAEEIIAGFVGPRPHNQADEAASRENGADADVLRHAGVGVEIDLRSTAQVKALLSLLGVQVADTRAGSLRAVQDRHPLVPALLAWRKAERIATTYGYAWLDEHLGADGRLRGSWTGCDGAAGRMTASGGLHNMPADLRPAVAAEPGQVFVRADLGQIEPRVLAAVSGDAALTDATLGPDLYAPVAAQLGVDRATAKVAVLGAMYGQTTGHGAQALRRLELAYPVAMAHLAHAARAAEAGKDLRTHGGRLVRMGPNVAGSPSTPAARAATAARGRYGRNAVVQGAAAELFKTWAVVVRARSGLLGARIVLCLHDELLVQAPSEQGEAVAALVSDSLVEAVHHWAPGTAVRFVADIGVIRRWSDAKSAPSTAPTMGR